MAETRVLVLGGTADANRLVASIAARLPEAGVLLSLAGRTVEPVVPSGCAVRHGGFGGAEALAAFLRAGGFAALIDATHPFAARISRNAAVAAAAAAMPCLHLVRPAWHQVHGDRWIEVPDAAAAAAALSGLVAEGRRTAFLTVGRQELAAFKAVDGARFLVRAVEPPAAADLPDGARLLLARGPFSLADERRLLTEEGVDVLVAKNSGGEATYAKIAAARDLGLPVVMLVRPPLPPGETVDTVETAVAWLERRLSRADG